MTWLLTVVVAILVAGFIVWLIGQAPFLNATMKQIAQGLIILVVIIWVLYQLVHHIPGNLGLG